jgi:Zn finger protein HypA/HybF involved in hydrogenase expression
MLCDYGCGKSAGFTLKNGKHCCSKRPSGCEVQKKINSQGLTKAWAEGRKGYTWNPNSAWSRGKTITADSEIFKENSGYANEFVKSRIAKQDLLEYRCSSCGIDSWKGETIVLDLDHVNGDNRDNRLENLRYLCPNCHSQTDTYKGRNKNKGTTKVSDSQLLAAYTKTGNIRQALLLVGLAAKGGNYERMKRLIARLGEPADPAGLKPAAERRTSSNLVSRTTDL